MNCYRIQSQLSAYIDQELNGDERRIIRYHLSQCSVCDREYQALTDLKQMMGSLTAPVPPESLLEIFHRQINGAEAVTLSGTWWMHNIRHLSLTAACFSLFLLTSLMLFPQKSSSLEIASDQSNMLKPITTTTLEMASTQQMDIASNHETFPKNKKAYEANDLFRNGLETVLVGLPVSR